MPTTRPWAQYQADMGRYNQAFAACMQGAVIACADHPTRGTMPSRRSVMVATLAAPLLALIGGHGRIADAAGPVIPLPDKDRTQLDALLGKGVVGDALPSAPLGNAATYMPPKGKATSYKVITQGEKAGSETHRVEDTTDPSFAPGTHYTIEQVGESFFQEIAAGQVITVAEKDLDNKVLSRFTPGDPLIVPECSPVRASNPATRSRSTICRT